MHSPMLLKSNITPRPRAAMGEGAASVSFGGSLHRNPVLLRGVGTGHDLGARQGERADRQRRPSLQETVRKRGSLERASQAGALREAERATKEKGHRSAQARPPTHHAEAGRMSIDQ